MEWGSLSSQIENEVPFSWKTCRQTNLPDLISATQQHTIVFCLDLTKLCWGIYSRGNRFLKSSQKSHFIHEKQLHVKFEPFWQFLNPTLLYIKFAKIYHFSPKCPLSIMYLDHFLSKIRKNSLLIIMFRRLAIILAFTVPER